MPDGTCYAGILEIPSLELALPVETDWSYEALQRNPCRYCGAAESSDLIVAAHNYKSQFGELKKLKQGDSVRFISVSGDEYSYTVSYIETIDPSTTDELFSSNWDLTLFTCTPGGLKRLTVRCLLLKQGA